MSTSQSSSKRSPTSPLDSQGSTNKKRQITSSSITQKAVSQFFAPPAEKRANAIKWRIDDDSLLIGTFQPPPTQSPILDQADNVSPTTTIAAFDLDGTLITPKSGRKFSIDAKDWKWWDPCVPDRLRSLHQDGNSLVIFTNQAGLNIKPDTPATKTTKSKGGTSVKAKRTDDFKSKCQMIVSQLGVPVTVYAATTNDFYRKPRMGMWYALLRDWNLQERKKGQVKNGEDKNNDVQSDGARASPQPTLFDTSSSVYVGDAAGRAPSNIRKDKDFSASDYHFATNIGISFFTPEEFFTNKPDGKPISNFLPSEFLQRETIATTNTLPTTTIKKPELVVFCGSPGAGKSTYFHRMFKHNGYARVNQDTLKTRDKCVSVATTILKAAVEADGKQHDQRQTTEDDDTDEGPAVSTSVVIDNTNPDRVVRKIWIDLARSLGIPVRCVYFSTPHDICIHNDTVRAWWRHLYHHQQHGNEKLPTLPSSSVGDGDDENATAAPSSTGADFNMNPENRTSLPKIAFSGFMSRFERPTTEEGFDEVVIVDFAFLGSDAEKEIWKCHWN